MIPLIEEYRGINKVRYKHIYYIGQMIEQIILKIDPENKDQYTEIKNIAWLTESECYQKIRDYDDHKKKVIKSFFDFYREIYDEKKIHLKI